LCRSSACPCPPSPASLFGCAQDTKNKYIPHKAITYYFITSAWSIYCAFTQLFVIFIAFGQLDLLLFRLGSDLLANYVTLTIYLQGKVYDPHMHAQSSAPVEMEEIKSAEQESSRLLEREGGAAARP
jgi:hypothetical protein